MGVASCFVCAAFFFFCIWLLLSFTYNTINLRGKSLFGPTVRSFLQSCQAGDSFCGV
jgi:hypothetical protein